MTTKIIKRAVPPPRHAENQPSVQALKVAVEELGGVSGDRMQRAVRVGEMFDVGLIQFSAEGALQSAVLNTMTNLTVGGNFLVRNRFEVNSTGVGFFGTAPISKPTITGSRAGNAAVASIATTLANLGLVINSTTA